YAVLSPEHPFVSEITTEDQRVTVEAYVEKVKNKSEIERTDVSKEKTGAFTGAYAINPANNERVPIWISDYVLMSYGTGAIMAVPAHDERDYEFATKFELPIVEVVKGGDITKEAYVGDGEIVNSQFLNGLTTDAAITTMIDWLETEKKGKRQITYRLRDWLFSRQRYWGE